MNPTYQGDRMPNRLNSENSPYLKQHSENPVDWYPWGSEALSKAKKESIPIFLSIGYSACHWCHVMEAESFMDPTIADYMNKHFVNIKVDREERPDLDHIYMQAVQAITGRGGWPMSVFLTPDLEPFYGGTYFPSQDRSGLPSFSRVLQSMVEAYHSRKDDVAQATEQLVKHLVDSAKPNLSSSSMTPANLSSAFSSILEGCDFQNGGVKGAPKFPQPMLLEALLGHWSRTQDSSYLEFVNLTLNKMACGGIYDQIGGGFHRYSTDPVWLVPHFEKMLYDNALLARIYLHGHQVDGGNPFYRRIVEGILDYVSREMTDPAGGFFTSQDADSDGVEGEYYVWSKQEIFSVFGPNEGARFCNYFGMTDEGNFEGKNILFVDTNFTESDGHKPSIQNPEILPEGWREKLLMVRNAREAPLRDEKILTSWNALMLTSFAEASAVLDKNEYLQIAIRNAEFLLENMWRDGRLYRTFSSEGPGLKGYLEDYSFLIYGLTVLYEVSFQRKWLDIAVDLAASMTDLFLDPTTNVFYDTGSDHEDLIVRPRDIFDNAMPCGGSVAVFSLLRLGLLTGSEHYQKIIEQNINSVFQLMIRFPVGFGNWICATDFYFGSVKEIGLVGNMLDNEFRQLFRSLHERFMPNKLIAGYDPKKPQDADGIPLIEGRAMVNGAPSAYVCENYSCLFPVNDVQSLKEQLGMTVD